MKKDFEDLIEQVKNCKNCELYKTRTNAVPGKGNFAADVVFVGEAPGRNEDLKGEPFVGIAGKKLSIALEEAGVSRDDVYITNTVKCRPPSNRVPNKNEKEECQMYIQKELQLIKPKMICVLGNTALGSVLNLTEISKYRGKTVKKGKQFYFVTIHPAAVIYNQGLTEVFKEDIKKLFLLNRDLKNGKKIEIDIEIPS